MKAYSNLYYREKISSKPLKKEVERKKIKEVEISGWNNDS